MSTDLAGRHVAVTGGTGALGAAIVEAARARGAVVLIPSHRDGVDLADEASVTRWFDAQPPLWASVHTAGGFAMAPIETTSAADWDAMQSTNARTCFLSCREAVRSMRRAGAGVGGRIVNVGSQNGITPPAGQLAYAASKAAVHAMTLALAAELKADGILVNAIVPSIIDTPKNRAAMPTADHAQWPTPAEIAVIVMALISPANTVTSGALIPVHGRS